MMARVLSAFVVLFVVVGTAAAASRWSASYESGRRTVLEDVEEADADDAYSFSRSRLDLDLAGPPGWRWDAARIERRKDYRDLDALDNRLEIRSLGVSRDVIPGRRDALRASLDVRRKSKTFHHSPRNEYDRVRLRSRLVRSSSGLFQAALTAGVENESYPRAGEKDRNQWFGILRAHRRFRDGALRLSGAASWREFTRKTLYTRRSQREVMGEAETSSPVPGVDSVGLRLDAGRRDTREEEDWDVDYDYRFRKARVRTRHSAGTSDSLTIDAFSFRKDYFFVDRDHRAAGGSGRWKHLFPKKGGLSFWSALEGEWKRVDYALRPLDNHRKTTLGLTAVARRGSRWSVRGEASWRRYEFGNPLRDMKRTVLTLIGSLRPGSGTVTFSLTGRLSYSDYPARNDVRRTSIKAGLDHRF